MNTIKTGISIDFNENRSLKVVRLKQNDTALRHIVVALSHNGVAVQLDSSEETAKVNVSVNGVAVVVNNNCTVYDNKVEFDVTEQMTTLAGEGICDIKIMKNSFTIYTASFKLLIEPSAVSTDTPAILSTTDLIDTINSEMEEAKENIALYIMYAIDGLYPEYTKYRYLVTVDNSSTLYGDNPYYLVESEKFEPNIDGIIVIKNNLEIFSPAAYYYDTTTVQGYVKIIFVNNVFAINDKVGFVFYRKPASGGGGVSGSAYVALSSLTTDSISGTATQEQEGE